MSAAKKVLLIMWKNWLFRKRQKITTAFELIIPALLAIVLVIIRTQGGDAFAVRLKDGVFPAKKSILVPNHVLTDCFNGKDVPETPHTKSLYSSLILYTPENAFTQRATKCIKSYLDSYFFTVEFKNVSNEEMMEEYAKLYQNMSRLLWGGVAFVNEFPADGSNPSELHYRIRPAYQGMPWNTDKLLPEFQLAGPGYYSDQYTSSYFILVQHLIAMFFIGQTTTKNVSSLQVNTQGFPYPPYYSDNGFSFLMENMLPLFLCLSFVFVAPTLIKRIVCEKELGIKELMKMMGLHGWIQWLGWFFTSFIAMGISAIIITILLFVPFTENAAVFNKSEPILFLIILLLYISCSITFCFFISSFFTKPSVASGGGALIWIMTFTVPYYVLQTTFDTLSSHEKLALSLLPNMAMATCLRIISGFESRNLGLQWNYLLTPGIVGDNICALQVMGMMILDIIFYSFLTWYIDNVFPGGYGTKKPFYFLFTKSYWKSGNSGHKGADSQNKKGDNFEEEPIGLFPTIRIQNLVKEYTEGQRAVDDISLNVYQGQITALLGHNGAGKTTTMSILTGMISPTSGRAYIENHDVTEDIESARRSLGLCPQHNMLFDILTVKEHLLFFGKLKGATGSQLDNEVKTLMGKLQLKDKENTLSQQLSGGMKRKLHLGIALVGGTKVVMLDEPTSGMDPEARRAIWDLLQDLRQERCILLSTHFMEEADVLSDRIAIMTHGKIYCCGSTMFLKKRFGAGYHLNISINEHSNVKEVTLLVNRCLPESYLDTHVNTELSFILPTHRTSDFPELFEILESQMQNLGISGFGVSVTTMEEVFLKVGETAEDDRRLQNGESNPSINDTVNLLQPSNAERAILQHNTGFELLLQQLWALLLKRWHYGRRRWILILSQIVIPSIMVIIILVINNNINQVNSLEPSRIMDLSQYGSTITVVNKNSSLFNLTQAYEKMIPQGSEVKSAENVTAEMFDKASEDIGLFNSKHIVAAEMITEEDSLYTVVNVLSNDIYFHTLPLSLNLWHNALWSKYSMGAKTGNIIVENAPLPKDAESAASQEQSMRAVKSIVMGVFIPLGMSVLAASFVIFPIHERVTKSKHIQLMTGIGGFLFWASSFLWDFFIHFISSLLMLLFFGVLDNSKVLSGDGQLGIIFFILLLYGWCAIPFSYTASFISKVPSTGFNRVTILNEIAGLIFSFMIFFFKSAGSSDLKTAADILQWFFRFIPIFPVTISFMNIAKMSMLNSACDIKNLDLVCPQSAGIKEIAQCCPGICGNPNVTLIPCFEKQNYLQWDSPGLGQEVMMMILDGFLYFTIIILLERGVIFRLWYCIKSLRRAKTVASAEVSPAVSHLDSDVVDEARRLENIIKSGNLSTPDALLVHNLTKRFWDFVAVDNINFGVNQNECFGLLGVNGAGKTTTFRMLTGDEIVTQGNAYMNYLNLKAHRSEFLKKITYCPQFDALIDHMTVREHLWLFSRLRGICEDQISFEIEKAIESFDLREHCNKIVLALSGGNKRKLSTALAFLGSSHMVFLDEPTTGVDPIARRKLWNILLAAKTAGKSIVLTSHSMEECEVLCSRLAIMVNGQFQCIGGIQHLKNKFGQGFTIMAKLKTERQDNPEDQQSLQNYILHKFSNCLLKDIHQGIVHYQVTDTTVSWKYLFQTMEEAKKQFDLEDYSVSQTTLEQIFLSFAKKQRIVADPTSKKNR